VGWGISQGEADRSNVALYVDVESQLTTMFLGAGGTPYTVGHIYPGASYFGGYPYDYRSYHGPYAYQIPYNYGGFGPNPAPPVGFMPTPVPGIYHLVTHRLVDIDDELLKEAAAVLGASTMKETVNRSLEVVVLTARRRRHADRLQAMRGLDLANPRVMSGAWR
jgi:Arc/MetJ family transcription regulator